MIFSNKSFRKSMKAFLEANACNTKTSACDTIRISGHNVGLLFHVLTPIHRILRAVELIVSQ